MEADDLRHLPPKSLINKDILPEMDALPASKNTFSNSDTQSYISDTYMGVYQDTTHLTLNLRNKQIEVFYMRFIPT